MTSDLDCSTSGWNLKIDQNVLLHSGTLPRPSVSRHGLETWDGDA